MQFCSMEPFIPSGPDFIASKNLFLDLGFVINWENGGYIGFQNNDCRFILQQFDDRQFAGNLMVRVEVPDLEAFWEEADALDLPKKYGIRITRPTDFPHGREVNLIDIAGVCWHFAQHKKS